MCTCNVRSLNRQGAISQLETVLKDYKAHITALQEIRWTGQGQPNLRSCDVYYSGHASIRSGNTLSTPCTLLDLLV